MAKVDVQAREIGTAAQRSPTSQAQNNARVVIRPAVFAHTDAKRLLRRCARALQRIGTEPHRVAEVREDAHARAELLGPAIAPEAMLSASVLCDLRAQGWSFRVGSDEIVALQPPAATDAVGRKRQVRAAHLLERDSQLRQVAVRRFIRDMERRRLFNGVWHSIYSLLRDGRELAGTLAQVAALPDGPQRQEALDATIDPYVEVVEPGATCAFTGLRLMDVWRYFRHTWATTYNSTPGRKMFFLVRDRAAANHPVIGIGALGSAIVQLTKRDEWIGWTPGKMLATMRAEPTAARARWLMSALERLIKDIRSDDLLRAVRMRHEHLKVPTEQQIGRLLAIAATYRARHRRYPERERHKSVSGGGRVDWREQSSTYLFRAKRAEQLAELLEARRRLVVAGFTAASASHLSRALADRDGIKAIQAILRRIKASSIGVHAMDITVCGAIAPYNALLGGKLVALLMASPEVICAYNTRYEKSASIIASSMAGRPIRRRPTLVLLGTTSLYDVAPAQYNRLRVPAEVAGGEPGMLLNFLPLGRTEGFGSYHFSRPTMDLLKAVVARTRRGRLVNSIFGEGVNPKLRKVRQALDALGFPANSLLQHGSPRLIYQVPLATNFREVLLGFESKPRYIVPHTPEGTAGLTRYWRERWLAHRITRADVLEEVAHHTRVYPVRHGARVPLPDVPGEDGPLFEHPATQD